MTVTATVREVAQATGMSPSAIYDRVRTNEIPNVALGRRVAIPRVWLNRYLREHGMTAPAQIETVASGTFS